MTRKFALPSIETPSRVDTKGKTLYGQQEFFVQGRKDPGSNRSTVAIKADKKY